MGGHNRAVLRNHQDIAGKGKPVEGGLTEKVTGGVPPSDGAGTRSGE